MTIEQRFTPDEVTKQKERLSPGHKLVLASPDALMAFAFIDKEKGAAILEAGSNAIKASFLLREYASIHGLLVNLVGKENLIVAKTKLTVGKDSLSGPKLKSIDLPEEINFDAVEIPFLETSYAA